MAKIVIAGDAVVITSGITLANLRNIAKYRSDALVLKGGEDGKEPVFAISVSEGAGSISKYGVTFGEETRDEKKLATLTMVVTGVDEDIKEFIADKLGGALTNLNKLEATLPAVVEAIADEKAKVMESITVVQ